MKAVKKKTHEEVSAPEGYHWTSDSGRYYLYPGKGEQKAKFRLRKEG